MILRQPAFALAATLLAGSPLLWAQAAIPPTPVTGQTAPLVATSVPAHGNRAEVTFKDGLLEVRANDSSLNVILRDVARVTGMTISGGVPEQRVFGTYGPADAGTVLATLLDGTGVNILVRENAQNAPSELVLTPRTGGPSLPSPSAPQYNAEAQAEAAAMATPMRRPQIGPRPIARPPQVKPMAPPAQQPANAMNANPNNTSNTVSTMPAPKSMSLDELGSSTSPASGGSSGSATQSTTTNAGTSVTQTTVTNANGETTTSTTTNTPNGSATTTTQSPNGVKTPEQIYQQLMKLQQQQQNAAGGSTSTTTSGSSTTPK